MRAIDPTTRSSSVISVLSPGSGLVMVHIKN
jgi:hypothetical protein